MYSEAPRAGAQGVKGRIEGDDLWQGQQLFPISLGSDGAVTSSKGGPRPSEVFFTRVHDKTNW